MTFAFVPNTEAPPNILTPQARPTPALNSVLAAAVDVTNGRLLYEKNANVIYDRSASTTKSLVAMFLAEAKGSNLSETVSVIATDLVDASTTRMNFSVGDTLTLEDLMHCIFIQSAGDATQVAARIVGNQAAGRPVDDVRGYSTFIEMLNARVREIGCVRTRLVSSDGLWHPITTASELARIAGEAFDNPVIQRLARVRTKGINITGPTPRVVNISNGTELIRDAMNRGAKYGVFSRFSMVSFWTTFSGTKIAIATLSTNTEALAWADHRAIYSALVSDFTYTYDPQAPVPGGHRYWRVMILRPQASESLTTSITRLEMYSSALDGAGRVDRCVGGTPLFSTQDPTNVAANVFNDSNATFWTTSPTGIDRLNSWIGYDFGVPIDIDRFAIQSTGGSLNRSPGLLQLEWSDDNETWVPFFPVAEQTSWAANEMRLFASPFYNAPVYTGSPHGTHRYWRIHASVASNGGTLFSAAEIEMRATPGGADQCAGGVATAHSSLDANTTPDRAFDDNTATHWSASVSSTDGWVQYDFGSPVPVAEVSIRARNDGNFGQTPRFGQIEFSDDGINWSVAWHFAMTSTYTIGSVQVTTDPAFV